MPKGQSPTERAEARMTLLDAQLKKMPHDYSELTKLKRRVRNFLGGKEAGMVTSMKRTLMVRKLDKLERSLGKNSRKLGASQKEYP
tara:strand:- start:623 stop:880 length:258 start_codon:yes stop_codon:yes gene_type:complete